MFGAGLQRGGSHLIEETSAAHRLAAAALLLLEDVAVQRVHLGRLVSEPVVRLGTRQAGDAPWHDDNLANDSRLSDDNHPARGAREMWIDDGRNVNPRGWQLNWLISNRDLYVPNDRLLSRATHWSLQKSPFSNYLPTSRCIFVFFCFL